MKTPHDGRKVFDADLSPEEEQQVEDRQALTSPAVFEIIRNEGITELSRPLVSLWWSGVAAGIAIGFSVLAEAILRTYLPNQPWRHLLENFGYCVGFLLVILARLQLFTENTITPILPLMANPTSFNLVRVFRLWTVVLFANVAGTLLFAAFFSLTPTLNESVFSAMLEISKHMMHNDWLEMLWKGIVSGWLIATLVWLMPNSEGFKFSVIILITYLIAVGEFTHVVAGSAEAFLLVIDSRLSLPDMLLAFMLPVLVGNVIGGTVLFSLIAYGQVKEEI